MCQQKPRKIQQGQMQRPPLDTVSSFGPPKKERHGQIRRSLVEGPKGDEAGVLASCGELILFSLEKDVFGDT